ncbi:murein biosynthesis integral membrane protein MurJ [Kaarinaea lacus]
MSKLIKSTAVVSFMTLLSRISGLARDIVFARFFGADASTDAFFVAFKLPNLLRRQFAEGAFSQAFVPVFTQYKTTKSPEEARELAANVTGTLGLVLLLITIVGVVGAPLLMIISAFGWWMGGDPQYTLATELLRFTFPYIFFISLTALAGGILNTYGKFAVPAFTPVLLNVCLIAAAILSSVYMDNSIHVLAWGVFVAGVVQLLFQLPFLLRLNMFAMPRWAWREPGVDKIKRLMVPAIVSSSVQQINIVIDVIIASFLIEGSISWLYYADRLVEFPLGVFGIAIATVILPSLSAKFAAADPEKFRHTLDWGLRLSMLIGVPATIGLILLSGPLLSTMFQYGEFDKHDVYMAQLALIAYSIGLLGFIYVKVLSPGYFARQDTKTPMKIAIVSMVIKIIVTLIVVVTMVKLSYEAPHVGLAATTALSAILQSWLLYRGLRKDGTFKPDPGWLLFLARIGFASLLMFAVLYFYVDELTVWESWSVWERAVNLALWVCAGGGVYLLALVVTGMKFKELLRHT